MAESVFKAESAFKVGIDLGTTNCALAFLPKVLNADGDTEAGHHKVQSLPIPQVVHASLVESRSLLPSFIYLPGTGESPQGALDLPWASNRDMAVGEWARRQGSLLPTRVVHSAKSWLCHTAIDRRQPCLPWRSAPEDRRVSPVEASTTYIQHLVDAWNRQMASDNPDLRLQNQEVVLTVPASFDPAARELTVEAARAAGLENLTLLEEPQAAFYAWIESLRDDWRKQVRVGDLLLVCDVGGGTTDFTLISVADNGGALELNRVAVGNHILLGGDNMDLALAHMASQELASSGNPKLDVTQFQQLVHCSRQAKENLLGDITKEVENYTLLGRGTRLVGGSIKGQISRAMVDTCLLDGFFPICSLTDDPRRARLGGLQEAGLPYAHDPAVTRHLAAFVRQQVADLGRPVTGVLFNGGVFKSAPLRNRVIDLIRQWSGSADVRLLEGIDLDQAVSVGATYYAASRSGRGIRIRGGASRSYYLGVEIPAPAVPGMEPPIKALCVVPFGMEEGSETTVPGIKLSLVVGEPVRFRFFACPNRKSDKPGDWLEEWDDDLEELNPLETALASEKPPGSLLPVTLRAAMTEVGTLELHCHSTTDSQTWKLEFEARGQV